MLNLDLVELADLVRPEQIVEEIVRQNPDLTLPVPIEEIARLAGISKIEGLLNEGFEGALVTNSAKSNGVIFYNERSIKSRQRFTIGHELGHFLLPWQRNSNFQCKSVDIGIGSATNAEWEIQANRFSADILMPPSILKQKLLVCGEPEMTHIIQLQKEFDTSMEMTARRLVEMSEYPCAVVFSKDNKVRYFWRSEYFPYWLCVKKGSDLPRVSQSKNNTSDIDEWYEIEGYWWIDDSNDEEIPEFIYEQTLVQNEGYKITLLSLS